MKEKETGGNVPEELSMYHQDLTREYVIDSFEDNYNFLKKQKGGGIIAQWNLASETEPRVVALKTVRGKSLLPYQRLDEELVSTFINDVDPETEVQLVCKDLSLDRIKDIEEFPDNMSEYTGREVLAISFRYKLREKGKYVTQTTYYSGSHSMKMIAERWTLDEENASPMEADNLFANTVVSSEEISDKTYPFPLKDRYLIPVVNLGFSKN